MPNKILADSKSVSGNSLSLLNLPNEMSEYVLAFCDTESLLQVRLTSFKLFQLAYRAMADRFKLSWKYCFLERVSPLKLISNRPSQYLSNLTVPLKQCHYALNWIRGHGLNYSMVNAYLKMYPNGEVSLPHGVYEVTRGGRNLAYVALSSGGNFMVWWKNESGRFISQIYSLEEVKPIIWPHLSTMIKNKRLILSHSGVDLGGSGKRPIPLSVASFFSYLRVCNPSIIMEVPFIKLAGDPFYHSICSVVRCESERVFLLEDGNIWFFPYRNKKKQENDPCFLEESGISKQAKVRFVSSGRNSFSIVLNDANTIIQYGFLDPRSAKEVATILQLRTSHDIEHIYSNDFAHVALLSNHQICTWGSECTGGVAPAFPEGYSVNSVVFTNRAFAVLLKTGRVVPWGDPEWGGQSPVFPDNYLVKELTGNTDSFVALLDDNTLVVWGKQEEIPKVLENQSILAVVSNSCEFMALLHDGRVCYWGKNCREGSMIKIPEDRKVKFIFSNKETFVIELDNGNLIPIGLHRGDRLVLDFSQIQLIIPDGHKKAVFDA